MGEINGFAEDALNAAYAEADAKDTKTILLNFKGVDYINSTGIALIVGLLAKARASHKRLLACNLSEHYVEIFNITRLSDFMSVFPDEEAPSKRLRCPEMEDESLSGFSRACAESMRE